MGTSWTEPRRGRSSRSRTGWNNRERPPLTLLLVDCGLLLIIVAAPFFMGGRQALGQLVLCLLAAVTALAWSVHQWSGPRSRWRFTGAEPILLAGLGLVLFQCVELSPSLLETLSPRLVEILPAWNAEHPLVPGPWSRISVTPADSWSNFVVIVACVLTFFVAVQRVRTAEDVHRLLAALGVAGIAMALLGIVQFFAGNGKFFWFYEHPMTDTRFVAKGAFTNANHFANFLAMSVPVQLYLIVNRLNAAPAPPPRPEFHRQNKSRLAEVDLLLVAWVLGLALTGLGILLSMSRGGIVFSIGGVLVTLLIFWRKSLLETKLASVVAGVAVLSLAGTLLFGDLAAQMVEQNFLDLTSSDLNQLDRGNARRKIWEANVQGIQQFPILGTGLGSHREVYWQWFNHPHVGKEYSHAENGYLQIALETGFAGIGTVGLLFLVYGFWCLRGLRRATSPVAAGAVAVATGVLVVTLSHSISDFVWYVPACVNVVLLVAVCAARIGQSGFEETPPAGESPSEAPAGFNISRLGWGCATPAALLLGGWMTSAKVPELVAESHWFEYVRLVKSKQQTDEFDSAFTLFQRQIDRALSASRANPNEHRIQLHAGLACLNQFTLAQLENENNMPLSQIREAARASFSSAEEMNEWLKNPGVIGETRTYLTQARDHFRQALRLCPLQPRAYLELAELAWLDGVPAEREQELVEQAIAARPYDARSRFALGNIFFRDDDRENALIQWKEAFRLDASYRSQVVDTLAVYVPAAFFLENFEPDLQSLRQLRSAYRESPDQVGYETVIEQLAKANVQEALLVEGLQAEKFWLEAHDCFNELENRKAAYHSARAAVDANPSSYQARIKFGLWLYENHVYEEAGEHLLWCHRRKPDVEWLRTLTQRALVEAERSQSPSATASPTREVRR